MDVASTPVADAATATETSAKAAAQDIVKPPPTRNARATVGKGAVILGQDGKTVKFRGKCTTCGREDTSWKTIAIPRGAIRASFFCAKCRKKRDIEIYGQQ